MKKLWLTLSAVLLSLCLASCGTGGNTPDDGQDGGTQPPMEQPNGDGDIELPPIDF